MIRLHIRREDDGFWIMNGEGYVEGPFAHRSGAIVRMIWFWIGNTLGWEA